MAGKFHINSLNVALPCNADKRACRFGGEDEGNHFKVEADAIQEAERRLKEDHGGTFTKTSKKKTRATHEEIKVIVENSHEKAGREHAEDAANSGLDVENLKRFATNNGGSFDKGYNDALDKAIADKKVERKTIAERWQSEQVKVSEEKFLDKSVTASEKVESLKEFSAKNPDAYNEALRKVGYSDANGSYTQRVMNGEFPMALRTATDESNKLKDAGKYKGMETYISQLEDAAHAEDARRGYRSMNRSYLTEASTAAEKPEVKLLSDDEILDPHFDDFGDDDED